MSHAHKTAHVPPPLRRPSGGDQSALVHRFFYFLFPSSVSFFPCADRGTGGGHAGPAVGGQGDPETIRAQLQGEQTKQTLLKVVSVGWFVVVVVVVVVYIFFSFFRPETGADHGH